MRHLFEIALEWAVDAFLILVTLFAVSVPGAVNSAKGMSCGAGTAQVSKAP